MRTLVFDIGGDYALFKKPYSPMSPVSYPLPPPPAVLGMLGALLGIDKDAYHRRLGWDRVRVAVAPRAPLRTFRAALNLLQTKDGTDGYFRPRAGQNTHTQLPCTFLREPRFRVLVAGLDAGLADELSELLRAGRSQYTVTLGLANCLAELDWVCEGEAEPLGAGTHRLDSAVPLGDGVRVHYEDGRRYHRVRIPALMDAQRVVQRYQEIVLAEDAEPIRVETPEGLCHAIGSHCLAFL
ncbi:MAG: type I-B CRISPR-associated protein Cas5 [Chromatiaceae bacterium]|nr:type I-B CRISPR-associated protein Cas5 [Chromatiaceae bacterium]